MAYNRVYNNIVSTVTGNSPWGSAYGITVAYSGSSQQYIHDNVFDSNLIYSTQDADLRFYSTNYTTLDTTYPYTDTISPGYNNVVRNNFDANPLFVNPINHDFNLQAGSPAINEGSWLAHINSATGSGTTFTVDAPGFFNNGYGIVAGDRVQVEGHSQTATITSVNYSTGAITVDSSLSWTQNQGLSLAYSGSGPDIGAKEYGATTAGINRYPDHRLDHYRGGRHRHLYSRAQLAAHGECNDRADIQRYL